jgi:hypothetical protein
VQLNLVWVAENWSLYVYEEKSKPSMTKGLNPGDSGGRKAVSVSVNHEETFPRLPLNAWSFGNRSTTV